MGLAVVACATLSIAACTPEENTPAGSATSAKAGNPTTTAEAAAGAPQLIDCITHNPVTRPDNLIVACGDSGVRLQGITWKSWGSNTAEGDGTGFFKQYQKSGPAKIVTKDSHIVLSDPVSGYFTKVVVTDSDGQSTTWPFSHK